MTATEQATDLSVERTLARQSGYESVHAQCRQTKDLPPPYGRGIPLARRSPSACHRQANEPLVKTIAGMGLYVAVVTGPVLALVPARTPH
ncbi:hypothetical protein [Streptomyces yatensis]|uniref:hypothetical protein n=1 Tax=Streptomyces yatensis TaxID=155177 RepID=UPI001B3C9067|nr:hypothetical protein [Streptomyces yatensis]